MILFIYFADKIMAKNKTIQTLNSVPDFINTVSNEIKRNDCFRLLKL
ncbi:hypothetical protein SAMN06265350_10926 [Solitalea koreensis]|uniref:Uncharacterized protein n=1 Tax=Solitalea koreensis TaxID=543615 RepID=A0A521DYN4_9SPHI|nr:hypothetical protein SAMN06265350_10926 [Solitalea koreensis]